MKKCVPRARYATAFHISCEIPFLSICLAYMLLRFSDEHIRDSDYHRFNLLGVAYQYYTSSIYGVAFYDVGFRPAYSRAVNLSFLVSDGFSTCQNTRHENIPVSTWFAPPGSDERMIADSFMHIVSVTRYVLCFLYWTSLTSFVIETSPSGNTFMLHIDLLICNCITNICFIIFTTTSWIFEASFVVQCLFKQ